MNSPDKINITIKKSKAALETVRLIGAIDEIAQENDVALTGVRRTEKILHGNIESGTSQVISDQMHVNEALVLKIIECQHIEEKLSQSENRLRRLVAHQNKIKEEERKRIAREIHDDLGQNLLVLRMDISRLHARSVHGDPHIYEWVGVMLTNIDVTIKSVRSIINDLRPFELELGLYAAAESHLKKFEQRCGIVCQLSVNESRFGDVLNDEQSLEIFRILQESLTNIARHSQATKIKVTLGWSGHTFAMKVKDNGVGIHFHDKKKKSTFGLLGIHERMNALNGKLIIDSGVKGTVLTINIPIEKIA
jgi:signal transduction histidine kinase